MILLRQTNTGFPVENFRRSSCFRAGLASLALAVLICRGSADQTVVQPPSPWVTPQHCDMPPAADAGDASLDYRWLLSDRQINALSDERFVHEVRQPLTSAGVQSASRILISYDPSFESLTFHWATIWRGTNKLDRLELSNMRASQAGPDQEEFLFSSHKTASLLLDDVRVGDIIDFAYTIEGGNPALENKFCATVQVQFNHPVDKAVTRLLWPASRRLYVKNYLTSIQPFSSRKGRVLEFTWEARKAPGLPLEPATPAWYDPYPRVQLSEFPNWSEVNRWALPLFTTANPPSTELARQINEWKKLPEPADQVLAALRFVQEEIRHTGAEEGPAGNEPVEPSVVFARRYGNCQDKTFLLVTILRALKIDAFPVLVNSRRRQEVAQLQPSPALFDHVLVQVNLRGQSFWLETTAASDRGALALRCWPSYGWGLPVRPGVTGLAPIPPCPVQPLTSVTEYFNIGGLENSSTVKLITVAEGPDANLLRQRFATASVEDIERENVTNFAKLYPTVHSAAPLRFSDDQQQNRIEMTEFFAIDQIWDRLPDSLSHQARIYAVNLSGAWARPPVSLRAAPLAARYPVHQLFHAEVTVAALPVDQSIITIRNPAFYFQRTLNLLLNSSVLIFDYEYRSLTDSVAPAAVPAYARDLNSATDALGYTVIGY